MKRLVLVFSLLIFTLLSYAQISDPVKWSFSIRHVTDLTYEIHLTAFIEPDWHIYSQDNPAEGPFATKIKFIANPLISLRGVPEEIGKLEEKREEVFDKDVRYYNSKVDFVQSVKLKKKVKTFINGSIEFMVCTDTQCLPPAKRSFRLPFK